MLKLTVEPVMFLYIFAYTVEIFLVQDYLLYRFCTNQVGDAICADESTGSEKSHSILTRFYGPRAFNPFYRNNYVISQPSLRQNPMALMRPTSLEEIEVGFFRIPDEGVYGSDADHDFIEKGLAKAITNEVRYYMCWVIGYNLVALITSQIYGSMTDRGTSKRTMMLSPLFGQLLSSFFFVMLSCLPQLPLEIIVFTGVLCGVFGGFITLQACILSYLRSCQYRSSDREATVKISLIEGALYSGGCLGLMYIRVAVHSFHMSYPLLFLVNMLVTITAILYTLIIVPKDSPDLTITRTENGKFVIENNNIDEEVTAFYTIIKDIFYGNLSIKVKFIIKCLLIAEFCSFITVAVEVDLSYVYLREKIGFDMGQYSLFFAINLLVAIFMLFIGLPCMMEFLALSDIHLATLAGFSRFGFFLFLAFNTTGRLIYFGVVVNMFSQMIYVCTKTIMSRMVPFDKQGQAFTILSSVEQVGILFGTLVLDNVYASTVQKGNASTVMYICASIAIVPIVMFVFIYKIVKLQSPTNSREVHEGTPLLAEASI